MQNHRDRMKMEKERDEKWGRKKKSELFFVI